MVHIEEQVGVWEHSSWATYEPRQFNEFGKHNSPSWWFPIGEMNNVGFKGTPPKKWCLSFSVPFKATNKRSHLKKDQTTLSQALATQ